MVGSLVPAKALVLGKLCGFSKWSADGQFHLPGWVTGTIQWVPVTDRSLVPAKVFVNSVLIFWSILQFSCQFCGFFGRRQGPCLRQQWQTDQTVGCGNEILQAHSWRSSVSPFRSSKPVLGTSDQPVTSTSKRLCTSKASKVSTIFLSDFAVMRSFLWRFRPTGRSLPPEAGTGHGWVSSGPVNPSSVPVLVDWATGTGKSLCTSETSKVNTNFFSDFAVIGSFPWPFDRRQGPCLREPWQERQDLSPRVLELWDWFTRTLGLVY